MFKASECLQRAEHGLPNTQEGPRECAVVAAWWQVLPRVMWSPGTNARDTTVWLDYPSDKVFIHGYSFNNVFTYIMDSNVP